MKTCKHHFIIESPPLVRAGANTAERFRNNMTYEQQLKIYQKEMMRYGYAKDFVLWNAT